TAGDVHVTGRGITTERTGGGGDAGADAVGDVEVDLEGGAVLDADVAEAAAAAAEGVDAVAVVLNGERRAVRALGAGGLVDELRLEAGADVLRRAEPRAAGLVSDVGSEREDVVGDRRAGAGE